MTDGPAFADDPDGTQEAIMGATYRALCEWGYADLTVARIADEFEKSKSLLYHHYDGKDDLLLAFLEYMLAAFEDPTDAGGEGAARERLDALLDRLFRPATGEDRAFVAAVVELRAQAAHDARYRDHFERVDHTLRDRVAALVREGVADGEFRDDADPEALASTVVATVDGALLRAVTSGADDASAVRRELDAHLDAQLDAHPDSAGDEAVGDG